MCVRDRSLIIVEFLCSVPHTTKHDMADSSPVLIWTVEEAERLDRAIHARLPEHSRSRIAEWIAEGQVLVDGLARTKPGFALRPGMTVAVPPIAAREAHDLTPATIDLAVVYEDEALLVIDKPRGLATHPASSLKEPSLVNALLGRATPLSGAAGEWRPGIVHRLDKETTGLLIVAKTDAAHRNLAAQIQAKTAERRYVAVVSGSPELERFRIVAPIGRDPKHRVRMAIVPSGKSAETEVKRLADLRSESVVACRLLTGRTHQIRVHLASVSLPVLGDPLYAPARLAGGPMQLHAAYLSFRHPSTESVVELFAAPPEDFLHRDRFDVHALATW